MSDGANFDEQSDAEKQGQAPAPDGAPPAGAGPDGSDEAPFGRVGGFLAEAAAVDPRDSEAAHRLRAGAQQFKDLASIGPREGGFAINEAGGQRHIAVCDLFLDGYGALKHHLQGLKRKPELGSGPYAQRVAEHTLLVADGDEQSLLPNLELFRETYETLKEGLQIAIRSYREEDAANDQYFRNLGEDEL